MALKVTKFRQIRQASKVRSLNSTHAVLTNLTKCKNDEFDEISSSQQSYVI